MFCGASKCSTRSSKMIFTSTGQKYLKTVRHIRLLSHLIKLYFQNFSWSSWWSDVRRLPISIFTWFSRHLWRVSHTVFERIQWKERYVNFLVRNQEEIWQLMTYSQVVLKQYMIGNDWRTYKGKAESSRRTRKRERWILKCFRSKAECHR